MYNVQTVYTVWIFLEKHKVDSRVPVGSIEGPGRGMDPIRILFLLQVKQERVALQERKESSLYK